MQGRTKHAGDARYRQILGEYWVIFKICHCADFWCRLLTFGPGWSLTNFFQLYQRCFMNLNIESLRNNINQSHHEITVLSRGMRDEHYAKSKRSANLACNNLEWHVSLILPAKSWWVQESLYRITKRKGILYLRENGKFLLVLWGKIHPFNLPHSKFQCLVNRRLKLKDSIFPQEHLVLSSCYKNCSPRYFNTNGADGEWHRRIYFSWILYIVSNKSLVKETLRSSPSAS